MISSRALQSARTLEAWGCFPLDPRRFHSVSSMAFLTFPPISCARSSRQACDRSNLRTLLAGPPLASFEDAVERDGAKRKRGSVRRTPPERQGLGPRIRLDGPVFPSRKGSGWRRDAGSLAVSASSCAVPFTTCGKRAAIPFRMARTVRRCPSVRGSHVPRESEFRTRPRSGLPPSDACCSSHSRSAWSCPAFPSRAS